MTGACINCGGLVRGLRARCVGCELDAARVIAARGEANSRNRITKDYKTGRNPVVAFYRIEEPMAEIPACPICKRRPQDGHDGYCTPERRANAEAERLAIDPPAPMVVRQGSAPVLPPTFGQVHMPTRLGALPSPVRDGPAALHEMNPDELTIRGKRGAASRIRTIAERKEIPVASLAETVAELGMPAPSDAPKSVEHPIAMADCATCGPKPRGLFSSKLNGDPFANCDPCRSDKATAAHAARKNKPADSVNETPIDTAAAGGTSDFSTTIVREKQEVPSFSMAVPGEAVLKDDRADDQVEISAPSEPMAMPSSGDRQAENSAPAPGTVADLRAERERLTDYLQDLDRRIEEAEVFEQLAGKSPAELQQLLDDAQRTARLCELALQGAA